MKKLMLIAILLAIPAFAAEQAWENVPLIDGMCLSKVKDNPDKHGADCLLKCSTGGLGILTADGYLKLDEEGIKKAVELVKNSGKKDGIRVDVKGEKEGEVIKVTSLSLK
jgi:hypothetical protein